MMGAFLEKRFRLGVRLEECPATEDLLRGISVMQVHAVDLEGPLASQGFFARDGEREEVERNIAWLRSRVAVRQAELGDLAGAEAVAAVIPPEDARSVHKALAIAYAARGDVRSVQASAAKCGGDPDYVVKPLCRLAEAAKKSDAAVVRAGLDEAERAAGRTQRGFLRASAMWPVAEAHARVGNLDAARALYDKAWNEMSVRDFGSATYHYLVQSMLDQGLMAEVKRKVCGTGLRETDREDAICLIAIAEAKAGDLAAATATAASIKHGWVRETAFYEMVPILISRGDLAGATESIGKTYGVRRALRELELAGALTKARDVAGGRGGLISAILRKHGDVRGVLTARAAPPLVPGPAAVDQARPVGRLEEPGTGSE